MQPASGRLESELPPEALQYQPRLAFSAGSDGLDHIRGLVRSARPRQWIAVEHDPRQAAAVRRLMVDSTTTISDPGGLERVTVGADA